MKKKILIFIVTLLMTGCNVVYNINISDNLVAESTSIYYESKDFASTNPSFNSDNNVSSINSYNERDYKAFNNIYDNTYYDKKIINDDIGSGINLSYSFNHDNFHNSNLINYCIGDSVVTKDDKYIIVDAKDLYYCFYKDPYELLSTLQINITTKLKVLKNNADEVRGNTYIWNYDKSNASDKNIYIKIKRGTNYTNLFIFILFVVIIVCLIVFLVFIIIKKNIDNNKI